MTPMRLELSCQVNQDFLKVKAGFNESLFAKLSPPFPPVNLVRYDGSETGDMVSMELNFFFFKQKWTSTITDNHTNSKEYYFVDEGVELPFFLKSWKHKHRIIKEGSSTIIRDEIEFKAPFGLLSLLLYPALYIQFAYRKPIYKKVFA
ncbi:Ligand-binding SRPBCC domain-containing protein [Algoriphagus aquimarinus]|uniref:Ligand-binding SRPBCC domain-containing protein n=2 Tax=Algoriphagus aquimarinus TaxID=237018 RepID=A0A1I0VRA1_9BACT|nr:Ligand-binding SRPBCC domain-containing protein [Algoriphagus aquimarinus]